MALRPCIECKKEISTEAKTCPNCGKPNQTGPTHTTSVTTKGPGCFKVGCGVLGVVFVIMLISINRQSTETPEAAANNARITARATRLHTAVWVCQEAAKLTLKAPTTAEFQPTRKAYSEELASGTIKVETYVDAQNSFGAQIRSTIRCRVKNEAVISLKFDQ